MKRDAYLALKKLAFQVRCACVSLGVALGLVSAPLQTATQAKTKSGRLVAVHQVAAKTGTAQKSQAVPQKGGKKRRAKRAATPSIQNHPNPERYQQIQQALADHGYFKGDVNGNWGQDSVDALRRFQADKKLDTDGKLTALTLSSLGLGPRHDGSSAPLSGPVAVKGAGGDTPSLNAPPDTPPQPDAPPQ
jgi:hypothetical protein